MLTPPTLIYFFGFYRPSNGFLKSDHKLFTNSGDFLISLGGGGSISFMEVDAKSKNHIHRLGSGIGRVFCKPACWPCMSRPTHGWILSASLGIIRAGMSRAEGFQKGAGAREIDPSV